MKPKNMNPIKNPKKIFKHKSVFKDPNVAGYIPREHHRHSHQEERAKEYARYCDGKPLRDEEYPDWVTSDYWD